MKTPHFVPGWALPTLAAVGVAIVFLRADAQDPQPKKQIDVCRHREADGRGAARVDLADLEKRYRSIATAAAKGFRAFEEKLPKMKARSHRSGMEASASTRERCVALAETVPAEYRKHTLYFVTAGRGGNRPRILPRNLPERCEVFVLEADTLEDAAAMAKTLGRRVTFATAEFARAVGVRARDAVVRFADDGKTAIVREEGP